MKQNSLILCSLHALCITALGAANPTEEYASLAGRLTGLDREQILETVRSSQWPELPALTATDSEKRRDLETIATQALSALKQEARSIAELSDPNEVLSKTLRAANVAEAAITKGGYLNELIAVSAERIFLLGAWNLLSTSPELAQKLIPAIEARRRLPNSKTWFLQRSPMDPQISARKREIEAMKWDVSGFQITMQLRQEGKDQMASPSVFAQVADSSIVDLWWEMYLTDFRVSAVLRSAIDFVKRGGVLVPEPKSKAAAIEAVFGPDGPPFQHELRGGCIRSDDIWTEWKAAHQQSLRDLQIAQWFGEP
jgi:hypothetical protein